MEQLLPDRLKGLWQAVDRGEITRDAFAMEQERLLEEYKRAWAHALLQEGQKELPDSLLSELAAYLRADDHVEIRRRCAEAVAMLKAQWHETVDPCDRRSIEQFYDVSDHTIYELTWWHALGEDLSPLAYVTALRFAQQHGCRAYLDFGAGVGSGAVLFARHGFDVTIADISSVLLRFSAWRLETRGLQATLIDLKRTELPPRAFDFVTAMDVFEHLVDPVDTVDRLSDAIRPGGYLYARIAAEPDEDRPQHIVQDFEPTFRRLDARGFVRVWQDDWLWGHQVFQKSSG